MISTNKVSFSHIIGPRRIGGRYHNKYWNKQYTVTAINGMYLTCDWDDGTTTTHCTAWEPHWDTIIAEPAGSEVCK